jgi:hypothetical protein
VLQLWSRAGLPQLLLLLLALQLLAQLLLLLLPPLHKHQNDNKYNFITDFCFILGLFFCGVDSVRKKAVGREGKKLRDAKNRQN